MKFPPLIHIHAKCDFFEIFEQVPEKKAVSRLETIKKMFLNESMRQNKISRTVNRGFFLGHENSAHLSVKTRLINPKLF